MNPKKKRYRFWIGIIGFVLFAFGFWQFQLVLDADEIHGWMPVRDFAELRSKWESYEPSWLHPGEPFHSARIHTGCALILFHWDQLSESERSAIHQDGLDSAKEHLSKPSEWDGKGMMASMSRLIVLKWNREKTKGYKMSALERDEWLERGRFFGNRLSPE